MTALLDRLALGVVAASLLVMSLAALRVSARQAAVGLALELWTAAGLLRLCGEPSWTRVATAAALIAVRRLVRWRRQASR